MGNLPLEEAGVQCSALVRALCAAGKHGEAEHQLRAGPNLLLCLACGFSAARPDVKQRISQGNDLVQVSEQF